MPIFGNGYANLSIPVLRLLGDTGTMTTKKVTPHKRPRSSTSGFFLYHGIRIEKPGKAQTEAEKIIDRELQKQSDTRGTRKSA